MFITNMSNPKAMLKPIQSFTATRIPALFSSDSGQAAAEYGLILALVTATVIVAVFAVGGAVGSLWNSFITAWPK